MEPQYQTKTERAAFLMTFRVSRCQFECDGELSKLKINSWMPLLHYTNMLRLGFKNKKAMNELRAGYGNIHKNTFREWRKLYQQWLQGGLESSGALLIGGLQATVVCDETCIGVEASDGWCLESKAVGGGRTFRQSPQNTKLKVHTRGIQKGFCF